VPGAINGFVMIKGEGELKVNLAPAAPAAPVTEEAAPAETQEAEVVPEEPKEAASEAPNVEAAPSADQPAEKVE
jgi:hypothetical protein